MALAKFNISTPTEGTLIFTVPNKIRVRCNAWMGFENQEYVTVNDTEEESLDTTKDVIQRSFLKTLHLLTSVCNGKTPDLPATYDCWWQ
jgi:hypothetical protein